MITVAVFPMDQIIALDPEPIDIRGFESSGQFREWLDHEKPPQTWLQVLSPSSS